MTRRLRRPISHAAPISKYTNNVIAGSGPAVAEVDAALIGAPRYKGSPSGSSLLAGTELFINTLASTPSHQCAENADGGKGGGEKQTTK